MAEDIDVSGTKGLKLPSQISLKLILVISLVLLAVIGSVLCNYTPTFTPRNVISSRFSSRQQPPKYSQRTLNSILNQLQQNQSDYLIYHPPIRTSVSGKYFDEVDKTTLQNLLPEPVELTESNINDFIFVSAISKNFHPRFTLLVESIQQFFPTFKLIVYDLGLTKQQNNQMQQWCQVQILKFDFAKYPAHVRSLYNYAFKPIAIADAMRRFNARGVFWVDASVRFQSHNISLIESIALHTRGVAAFGGTSHSIYAVTPPDMYDYLPIIKSPAKSECLMGTLIRLYKTKLVIDHVMHWWVACALSPACIYSFGNRFCSFKQNRWDYFAYCSRFDQSALSIILYNTYDDIQQILAPEFYGIPNATLTVQRGGSGGKVLTCDKKSVDG